MNVLMVGVDKTSVGGMLTVIENYLNSEEFCKKTNLTYVSTVIRSNKLIKILKFLVKVPEIIYIIKNKHIDIVHVHMGEKGSVYREGFVIWLARKLGCKTVIHMHGATIEVWYNKQSASIKKLIKRIFRNCDCLLVLGDTWKPFFEKIMGEQNNSKIKVLHNAVDVPEKNMFNPKSRNFLFYGMLIQRKGIDDLLQAFADIKEKIPNDVNLLLYGDDYDSEEKIQEKIERFQLTDRAIYKGWLTSENRDRIFSEVMCNILPSYNEGLPMTILESMAFGIPNISTRIAAIPEAIDDDLNGLLINAGDVDKLAACMKKVANDNEYRIQLSNNAYKTARDRFSFNVHINKLLSIYEELLK